MARDLRAMVGKMRHRLVVTTITETQETTLGSWTQAEATDSTRWASIEPITASERLNAGQVIPEATHVIRMRYNTAVVATAVLKKGSREFEVVGPPIDIDERRKVLEFMVKELV